jgi:Xaa-Pro dipeptidase
MAEFKLNLEKIQTEIRKEGLDGWLFYDFRGTDPLGLKILGFKSDMIRTRRWYYIIPAKGEPKKLVHRIELASLDHLDGDKRVFLSWKELHENLKWVLSGCKKIAMQYSPGNAIPYISKVDAGTMELVQSFGVKVFSSANLIQTFEALLTQEELGSHLSAAKSLRKIIDKSFIEIGKALSDKNGTDEYQVQQFICSEMEKNGMQIEEMPIVAVNENSGNPHYEPSNKKFKKIGKGDLVLLDVFARNKGDSSIFADYTWVGYTGDSIPQKISDVFEIVRDARDQAFKFIYSNIKAGKEIHGCEVDDAARNHIKKMGYGDYFIHRTGHSIGRMCHGNGAHMDNLETRDERKLVPGLLFSIEPGIYLKEFGIRSEIDVYIEGKEAKISGLPIQTEIVKIA